ncbi:MAG: ATP-grasp domain-containing protein [Planctomycetaceae bacterium]|nr:ATP-grasp domain-containing protein [Planctomycetaceae bacterium]
MLIIFCADPLSPNQVEDGFQAEYRAAIENGFETALIDFDLLSSTEGIERALRRIQPYGDCQKAIYRGWMLKPDVYGKMYNALKVRGVVLVNQPDHYRLGHYLPEYYPLIRELTPESIWLEPDDTRELNSLMQRLEIFSGGPVIVKDYVKSCKHDWYEACYIPDSSSEEDVARVVDGFLERQGEDLNGNLVFRKYLEFEKIGIHPVSKLPLSREFRLFIYQGELAGCFPYWNEVDYDKSQLNLEMFKPVISRIPSSFFTLDVALTIDHNWMIVEMGDGQVSGFPNHESVIEFYSWLRSISK